MVSQNELLSEVRNCLTSLPEEARRRIMSSVIGSINMATAQEEFEETWRPALTCRLARVTLLALAEDKMATPTTWATRRPYAVAQSRLKALTSQVK